MPRPNGHWYDSLGERIVLTVVALLVSEWIMGWAACQYIVARQLTRRLRWCSTIVDLEIRLESLTEHAWLRRADSLQELKATASDIFDELKYFRPRGPLILVSPDDRSAGMFGSVETEAGQLQERVHVVLQKITYLQERAQEQPSTHNAEYGDAYNTIGTETTRLVYVRRGEAPEPNIAQHIRKYLWLRLPARDCTRMISLISVAFVIFTCCSHGEWTMTHALFILMGGFYLYDGDKPCHPPCPAQVVACAGRGLRPPTQATIEDKSKGDWISKSIAVIQTLWFVMQFIAPASQHPRVAITGLEIVTLAYGFQLA